MNYEQAGEYYLRTRNEIDELNREHKEKVAGLKEKLNALESWFTTKAQEDGLKDIKTPAGTAYWSTHHSATVGSREDLFSYCKENDAWDLLESRASKTAVRSFIEAHGEEPPGVNYSSVRVFNFRKSQERK